MDDYERDRMRENLSRKEAGPGKRGGAGFGQPHTSVIVCGRKY